MVRVLPETFAPPPPEPLSPQAATPKASAPVAQTATPILVARKTFPLLVKGCCSEARSYPRRINVCNLTPGAGQRHAAHADVHAHAWRAGASRGACMFRLR